MTGVARCSCFSPPWINANRNADADRHHADSESRPGRFLNGHPSGLTPRGENGTQTQHTALALRDTERVVSRENVEMLRRGYEALASGRVDFEGLDPEIEWRGPREFPDLAEPRYGHEGVRQYMAKLSEVLDDYRVVAEEFIDAGDNQVLVFSREGGSGKGSGAPVQTHPTAHLWALRDGKAIRMQSYWERSEALEAVGLSG
jgi:ketosteroid isomerase-like protein